MEDLQIPSLAKCTGCNCYCQGPWSTRTRTALPHQLQKDEPPAKGRRREHMRMVCKDWDAVSSIADIHINTNTSAVTNFSLLAAWSLTYELSLYVLQLTWRVDLQCPKNSSDKTIVWVGAELSYRTCQFCLPGYIPLDCFFPPI